MVNNRPGYTLAPRDDIAIRIESEQTLITLSLDTIQQKEYLVSLCFLIQLIYKSESRWRNVE